MTSPTFVVGANLPWISYGGDFGANAWRPAGGVRHQLDDVADAMARAADADPRDGRVGPREWLQYPVRRVPELSVDPGRARALKAAEGAARAPVAQQVPRAFFRRDSDAAALTIRKTP